MRRPLRAALPPLLLLLLAMMCCAGGCLAAARRCVFDEVVRKCGSPPAAVVREVPRKGQGATQAYTVATPEADGEWRPIRVLASTRDLEDPEKHCSAVDDVRPDFLGGTGVCLKEHLMTRNILFAMTNNIIPGAIGLHSSRLLVRRVRRVLMVPPFNAGMLCSEFSVPVEHYSPGIADADLVLYVGAGPSSVSWALACATEGGRPFVGGLHIAVPDCLLARLAVRIVAHEVAHALGFNYQQMAGLRMVSNDTTLPGGGRAVVTTAETKKQVQAHYSCSRLDGMELQTTAGGAPQSHWTWRSAKDELMSEFLGEGGGLYTALTMAVFADMPFYKVRWEMAEPMSWGNGSGCGLLEGKSAPESIAGYSNMFCDVADQSLRCTSDRNFVGRCTSVATSDCSGNGGSGCSFVASFLHEGTAEGGLRSFCADRNVEFLPGGRTGIYSWCLDAESLTVTAGNGSRVEQEQDVGGVCAQVMCDKGKVWVRYLGNNTWHDCRAGGFIAPASPAFKDGGRIWCPEYSAVCTIAPDGSSFVTPGRPDAAVRATQLWPLMFFVLFYILLVAVVAAAPL
ncbi:surface protease GP63 [Trypanosoma conorhini]|uniref:Leishmanolysin-like peptidase n=1 Tax=Trypanosoma conorhini TaxID=83891 RepID=A0A422NTF3_9TRYP|nr:surface protease GP63 [Trypanosoma conorhini]RNF08709.1 surface protease GP63 [Trypanosoma conorhini]